MNTLNRRVPLRVSPRYIAWLGVIHWNRLSSLCADVQLNDIVTGDRIQSGLLAECCLSRR